MLTLLDCSQLATVMKELVQNKTVKTQIYCKRPGLVKEGHVHLSYVICIVQAAPLSVKARQLFTHPCGI